MKKKTFYERLGLRRGASDAEIRRAFRKLAQRYHPDSSGKADSAALFNEIAEAYAVLSNAAKRAAYEKLLDHAEKRAERVAQYRRNQQRGEAAAARPRGAGSASRQARKQAAPERGFSDWLKKQAQSVFRPGRPTAPRADRTSTEKAEEQRIELEVSVPEAILGTTKEVSFLYRSGSSRSIRIKLPPGLNHGTTLSVPCAHKGELPAAVLKVKVTLLEHPWLGLSGNDILLRVPITIGEAISGTDLKVPGLSGPLPIRIPPGTASGTVIRIGGAGITNAKRKTQGDLCVIPLIAPPDRSSAALKEAAKAIEDHYSSPVRRKLPTRLDKQIL